MFKYHCACVELLTVLKTHNCAIAAELLRCDDV
jgi:hypothetical protein